MRQKWDNIDIFLYLIYILIAKFKYVKELIDDNRL